MSETWIWNDVVSGSLSNTSIQFIADNNLYNRISASIHTIHAIDVTALYYDDERAYESQAGAFEFGKTITFLTKPSGNLLTYLQSNATKKDVTGLKNLSSYNQPTSVASMKDVATKQDKITGGATTITSSNLTANRALISNSSGKVAVSPVTSTELGYLDGVTSNVQTQLNSIKISVTNIESDLTAVIDKYYYTSGTLVDGNIDVADPSALINSLEIVKDDIADSIRYSTESVPYLVCQSGSSDIEVVLRLTDIEDISNHPLYIFTAYYLDAGNYYHGMVQVDQNGIAQFSERKEVVSSVNSQYGDVEITSASIDAVPISRTVNNKALSSNITLTASDVSAIPNVPVTTTNNSDMLMVIDGNWQTDHGETGIQNASSLVTNLWPDNVTVVVNVFRRWGKLCLFTLQIMVNTDISTDYGFALFQLPYATIDRVWINNKVNFYIDTAQNYVKVNNDRLSTGGYTLTGFYLTTDNITPVAS